MYITPPERRQSVPPPPPSQPDEGVKNLIAVLCVVVLLGGFYWWRDSVENDPEKTAVYNKHDAYSSCISQVKYQLHDPTSAEFEPLINTVVLIEKDNSTLLAIPFRAKNGFGALRKSLIHCDISFYGKDYFKVNQVKIEK